MRQFISAGENNSDSGIPLTGKSGKPLRFFTKDGRPVTDKSGRPLRNIAGNKLLLFNSKTSVFEDVKGNPLRDACGRQQSDFGFDPEKPPQSEQKTYPILDEDNRPKVIYDIVGNPLTDFLGLPLTNADGKFLIIFDSNGDPVSDLFGRKLVDKFGVCITDTDKAQQFNRYGDPLRLFDSEQRPLTDSKGCPLLDIKGNSVLQFRNSKPIRSQYGSDIYDACGNISSETDYNPALRPIKIEKNAPLTDSDGNVIVAFDYKGYPVTDMDGIPIVCANGKTVIKEDKKRNILVDYKGKRLIRIRKSHYSRNKCRTLLNENGFPARIFDMYDKPLTSSLGEPQAHADGTLLIFFDLEGNPNSDYLGRTLYDERRCIFGEHSDLPHTAIDMENVQPIMDRAGEVTLLFDRGGMPLIDCFGFSLFDANGEQLVRLDENGMPVHKIEGRTLFLQNSLPLVVDPDASILSPRNLPVQLYDHSGTPLTDSCGFTLRTITGEKVLKLDRIGAIVSDFKGGNVFDSKGTMMDNALQFHPGSKPRKEIKTFTVSTVNGVPQPLYNCKGYPLTDSKGVALIDKSGNSTITFNCNNEMCDLDGKSVYSIDGEIFLGGNRLLLKENLIYFDVEGRPLTNRYGVVLKTRGGQDLVVFDASGAGISDFEGRPIVGTAPADMAAALRKAKMAFNGDYQLFDREDLPLVDQCGTILKTSKGRLLILCDRFGKPISDYKGGPVFDEHGIPLNKSGGRWVDQKDRPYRLFDTEHRPLTDADGAELYDIANTSLVQLDEIGRPVLDRKKRPVFDAAQHCVTERHFDGASQPKLLEKRRHYEDDGGGPLLLYDRDGLPLTDGSGASLSTCEGISLIDDKGATITDYRGGTVFDSKKIPLGCKWGQRMVSMSGRPLRLFDSRQWPLTSASGYPLALANDRPLIVFGRFGRPRCDSEGGFLYDGNNVDMDDPLFDPTAGSLLGATRRLLNPKGEPVRLFAANGMPRTDTEGYVLVDSNGSELVSVGFSLGDRHGNIFDECGNLINGFNIAEVVEPRPVN